MRVLELFCGIGGCAAALGGRARVVAAVDINHLALEVYATSIPHPVRRCSVESMRPAELEALAADLWWLSPPCQPYTRRGVGRDLDDPRAAGLRHLTRCIAEVRPPWVALENVPEFARSRSCGLLLEALEGAGYAIETLELCPTTLGIPNRRRRFYLLAGERSALRRRPAAGADRAPRALVDYLDPEPAGSLAVDPELLRRYAGAADVVRPDDPTAIASTFTSAYGRSPVRSGSYLQTATGYRRFSPAEILRLLGFPAGFRLPPTLSLRNAWRLVGNSVSVVAVRHLLAAVPGLDPDPRALSSTPPAPPAGTSAPLS